MSAQSFSSELKEQVVREVVEIGPDYRGGREVLWPGAADSGELGQEMEKRPPRIRGRGGEH